MMWLGVIGLYVVTILLVAPGVLTLYFDDDTEGYFVKQTLCFCDKTALEDDIEGHPVYCNRYYRCKPDPETIYFHKHEFQCADDYSFNPASALDKSQPPCMQGSCNGPVGPTTEAPVAPEPILLKEAFSRCFGQYKYHMEYANNCLWFYKCIDARPNGWPGRDLMECPHGWGFDADSMFDANIPPCKKGLCLPGEFNCTWIDASANLVNWQNPHNCHEYYSCRNGVHKLHSCQPSNHFFHKGWGSCQPAAICPQIKDAM